MKAMLGSLEKLALTKEELLKPKKGLHEANQLSAV